MTLQTRVTNILTKPAQEWRVVAAESADVAELMRDYAAPLAAIPAACRAVGLILILRTGLIAGVVGAVVSWAMALVGAYVAAVVIEKLAPTFQSRGSTVQALKLVVYSMTPVWVAGVLYLIPPLAGLTILAALYAIYLFYLGLSPLMNTPHEQVIPYMLVSALLVIVVSFVLGLVAATLVGGGSYVV